MRVSFSLFFGILLLIYSNGIMAQFYSQGKAERPSDVVSSLKASQTSKRTPIHSSNIETSERSNPWIKWDLSEQEWELYLQHMKGPRGIWSPNLDPLTVLGVEATTEEERRYYAEKLAKIEFERVVKELAFDRAYSRAATRLNPNLPMIDLAKLNYSKKIQNHLKPGERVLFFTQVSPCGPCERALFLVLERVRDGGQADIYLTDAKSDDDIRQWAAKHKIDPQLVRSKQLSLNHDRGLLNKLSKLTGTVPYVAVKRGDKYFHVKL